jgi:hypothetical protein
MDEINGAKRSNDIKKNLPLIIEHGESGSGILENKAPKALL